MYHCHVINKRSESIVIIVKLIYPLKLFISFIVDKSLLSSINENEDFLLFQHKGGVHNSAQTKLKSITSF